MANFNARLLDIANQVEKLSTDLAAAIPTLKYDDGRKDVREISDYLFSLQSKLRYNCSPIIKGIWEDDNND